MRSALSCRILGSSLALVTLVGLTGCASLSPQATAMPATSASPSPSARIPATSRASADPRASSSAVSRSPSASPSAADLTSTGAPVPTGHEGRYVAIGLGDSVPSAANCTGCVSYVNQVGEQIAERTGEKAVVDNDAVAGYTTSDVLSQLEDESVRARIADSDLVLITVGANDLADGLDGSCDVDSECMDTEMAEVKSRLTTIVEEVRDLQSAPDATVTVTGYWNVGEDGEVGRQNGESYVTESKALTRRFNSMAAGVASSQKVIYADFWTPFVGADGTGDPTDLLVSDGDHPNAAGHARLAAAVMSALGL